MVNMTATEVKNFLNGKRVFVGAHSADIQKLAFAVGYLWGKDPMDVVKHLDKPFLFFTIKENGAWIKSTLDLAKFNNSSKELVTAEDLLSIRIADSAYQYVTPEEYINNHKEELQSAAKVRSISETLREGRYEDLPVDVIMAAVEAYYAPTVSVPTQVTYVTSSTTDTDNDNRRYYALGYENGWADKEEGLEYNPSID